MTSVGDQAKKAKEARKQAFWPLIGFVLAIASGVMAFVLAPEVNKLLRKSLPNFRQIAEKDAQLFTTGVLFIVFVLLASLVVAAAVPRKKDIVSNKAMADERQDLLKEKRITKLRRKQMNKMNKG